VLAQQSVHNKLSRRRYAAYASVSSALRMQPFYRAVWNADAV